MFVAITREVSRSIAQCELTHLDRQVIDVDRARAQHLEYERCLESLGCKIVRLPEAPDLPDSVFVEDAAVVVDEVAIITRPGAESRRRETEAVAEALKSYRKLSFIKPPGTVDGGDVLRVGRTLFVGLSGRTNEDGVNQMRVVLAPLGYSVQGVVVNGCLHLKTAVTQVSDDAVLLNRAWVSADAFHRMRLIDVDESEPFGANGLLVNSTLIYPLGYPRTKARLEKNGVTVRTVNISELAMAEAGVTCCSIMFEA